MIDSLHAAKRLNAIKGLLDKGIQLDSQTDYHGDADSLNKVNYQVTWIHPVEN